MPSDIRTSICRELRDPAAFAAVFAACQDFRFTVADDIVVRCNECGSVISGNRLRWLVRYSDELLCYIQYRRLNLVIC